MLAVLFFVFAISFAIVAIRYYNRAEWLATQNRILGRRLAEAEIEMKWRSEEEVA